MMSAPNPNQLILAIVQLALFSGGGSFEVLNSLKQVPNLVESYLSHLQLHLTSRISFSPKLSMASGLVVDPKKLLILAPVVTSASTFWFAVDQSVMLSIYQYPQKKAQSNAILPHFFDKFLPRALTILFGLNGLSAAIAYTNILTQGELLRRTGAASWYAAGASFSLAHFAFAPAVAYKVRDIVEDEGKGRSTAILAKWMTVHRVRMLTVDLFSLVSFLVAACSTITLQ
jgi:hypothetical protein